VPAVLLIRAFRSVLTEKRTRTWNTRLTGPGLVTRVLPRCRRALVCVYVRYVFARGLISNDLLENPLPIEFDDGSVADELLLLLSRTFAARLSANSFRFTKRNYSTTSDRDHVATGLLFAIIYLRVGTSEALAVFHYERYSPQKQASFSLSAVLDITLLPLSRK